MDVDMLECVSFMILYCTYRRQVARTFLLLLGRPSSLVLLDTARAVRADRGAVDAGVLLLGLVFVHVLALTGDKKESKE